MLEKIISGGQSGADIAGWRAAKRFGLATAGWMPRRFLTETGPRPEFAELYGAKETESPGYPERTRRNLRLAELLLWFGDPESRGGKLTLRECPVGYLRVWDRKPYNWTPARVAEWLGSPGSTGTREGCRTLMVAGNRESGCPGIGEWAETYLCDVFRLMGFTEVI